MTTEPLMALSSHIPLISPIYLLGPSYFPAIDHNTPITKVWAYRTFFIPKGLGLKDLLWTFPDQN